MGQPFPQEVTAGGQIVVPSIHSPNYVLGSSGWTINLDGSAELNNLTVRGTFQGTNFVLNTSGLFLYSGVPANGNLVSSITNGAGTDSFGNAYGAGFESYGALGVAAQITASVIGMFSGVNVICELTPNGFFIYNPFGGLNALIGSWAAAGGTDAYGNVYPAGINVTQGALTGIGIANATISGSTITTTLLQGPTITAMNAQGGTITETTITFDSSGGVLLGYTTTTTTVTTFAAGTWQPPAGVTVAKVELWGAGAGGGGGNTSTGGEAGGGGEYASEPNLPVDPTVVYPVQIGSGGPGGSTGFGGSGGGDTTFGNTLVVAHAGTAGSGGNPGFAGTGSSNTVHFNGGNGGFGNLGVAGAGGGGSGGSTGAGGGGGSGGASAGAGGTAGSGGGAAGGAGGASAANGSGGSAPGAGGGGAGKGSATTTVTETFRAASTHSYYSDSGLRNTNGTMFHGSFSGEAPAYQYSYIQWATGSLGNSLNTVLNDTVISVKLRLNCQHSWFNSGMTFGLHSSTVLGGAQGTYGVLLSSFNISEGATTTFTLNSATWAPFKAGGTTYMVLAPNSANLNNLQWYGYFDGPDGTSNEPLLTVTYQTGSVGSFNGGNGADGAAKITYTSASVLALSASPVSGTDSLANAYPAGLMSQALTLLPVATPATPTAKAVLYADTNSNLERLVPSGRHAVLSDGSGDVTTHTVTAATATQLSASFTIAAADALAGTMYRLLAKGWGTWGSTIQNLAFGCGVNGSQVRTETISSAVFAASAGFEWESEYTLTVLSTGTTGKCWLAMRTTLSGTGVSHTLTTGQLTILTGSNGASTGETINTTVSNTQQVMASWASTTGAPTLTCVHSSFERIGT